MNSGSAPAPPLRVTRDPIRGINLAGFLEAESGLGEIARRLGKGLERAGVPFTAISYRRTPSRQEHPLELKTSDEALYDTNLICLNADYLTEFVGDVGVEFFARRYSIGVWFWETNTFRSEDRGALRYLDEVWVASEYVRRAVAAVADVPVHIVPVPIEEPPEPTQTRSALGLPDGFVFLFLFDFVSAERKNPISLVEAFKQAFAPGDGAILVLKSINGRERKPRRLQELQAAAAGRPDILVRDGYVSAAERDSFIAACDCFVSLHRSEGFGLTMAEAMAYGKPVIATAYSGNMEFMDEGSSYLVPYRLTPIPVDWWAYSPGAEWAEPNVPTAAELMRRVFEHQPQARARGERARVDLLRRFSLDRTARFIVERLDEVHERRASTRRSTEDVRRHILDASQVIAKGVGASLGHAPGRGAAAFLRRFLLRALWPYVADQQRVNAAVLDALVSVQRSVDELATTVAQLDDLDESRKAAGPHTAREN